MSGFAVDTSKPLPGPWRMPRENERRCRVYLEQHWQDCVDVCEVNPDAAERTDATVRLIAAAPDMLNALRHVLLLLDSMNPTAEQVKQVNDTVHAAWAKATGRK